MRSQVFTRYAAWCSAFVFIAALTSSAISQNRQKPTAKRPVAKKTAPTPIPAPTPAYPAYYQSALDAISEDSLKGHLSFIASDLLEGRDTPSPGLDIAAEYIAAQFRRAGVEPAGDADASGQKTYFQIANWKMSEPDTGSFVMKLQSGEQSVSIAANQVSLFNPQPFNITDAAVIRFDEKGAEMLAAMKPEQLTGKVLIADATFNPREHINKLIEAKPALLIALNRSTPNGRGLGSRRLYDPETTGGLGIASIQVHSPEAIKLFDALATGETAAKVSLKLAMKQDEAVKLKNVAAILPGSDPVLKDTYVLVTAHYDHIGVSRNGEGDRINNGANDDGSGTVSVIELATALSKLKERPKRSIVFLTVFGEEKGLLGSRYYGRHPLFPIAKTVADVNLEHIGRTDDVEGDKTGTATLTGFDFTDVSETFRKAGELTGVKLYKHEQNSDSFFGRSDNQALADQGVPAHTLCVAFIFPDYHRVGDHWNKINYPNLAKTNRMVALSLLMLADNPVAPKWNEANPKTAKYVTAWKAQVAAATK